jgi:hypothetical protein
MKALLKVTNAAAISLATSLIVRTDSYNQAVVTRNGVDIKLYGDRSDDLLVRSHDDHSTYKAILDGISHVAWETCRGNRCIVDLVNNTVLLDGRRHGVLTHFAVEEKDVLQVLDYETSDSRLRWNETLNDFLDREVKELTGGQDLSKFWGKSPSFMYASGLSKKQVDYLLLH